jgi:hypothetical protein
MSEGGEGSAAWLLQLERASRRAGSGIDGRQLLGCWRLVDLWDRSAAPQPSQSSLLRLLDAQLEIGADEPSETGGLRLGNRVRLGSLELAFNGVGWLDGRRPLLRFRFTQLQLSLGRWRIWQQKLPAPDGNRGPFFALIAAGSDQQGRWLLARGRGGGLARWRICQASGFL